MKRFVGRTKNAVLSQLWVATCMYLLLAYLKFVLRLSWSLHQIRRVAIRNGQHGADDRRTRALRGLPAGGSA